MGKHGLHIAVAATPAGGLKLESEIQLLKSALLYGDRVTVYSPGVVLFGSMAALRELDPMQTLAALIPAVQAARPEVSTAQLEALSGFLLTSTRRQRRSRLGAQADKNLRKSAKELRKTVDGIFEQAGFDHVVEAINSGIVEVANLGNDPSSDEFIAAFMEGVFEAVEDAHTYPLLGDGARGLVRAGVKEGMIGPGRVSRERGKQVALANDLLARLPTFEQVPMAVVLRARQELERHLAKFRSAIMTFSEEVETEAWDNDFPVEAEEVFLRDVEPAVRELEEAIKDNRFLAEFSKHLWRESATRGSIAAVLLNQLAVSDQVTAMAGAGVAVVSALERTRERRRERRRNIEANSLFFYQSLRDKLK